MKATQKLHVLDLFSGIGGFSLGLERTGGFETVAFCEIEAFPRSVLSKHWPKVPIYEDVKNVNRDRLIADGIAPSVITAGFPCQDISIAGNKAGITEGTRSGLWSEVVRLVCEIRPRFLIVENVPNLLGGPSESRGGWFGQILGDLAQCGYDAEWEIIPASAVGLPHRRKRVWIIAYPHSLDIRAEIFSQVNPSCVSKEKNTRTPFLPPYPLGLDGVADSYSLPRDDGFSAIVDRLSAYGNAVVPQIPEMIGHAILETEIILLESTK